MKKGRTILYFIIMLSAFFYNFYFRPIKGNPLVNTKYKKSKSYVNDLYKSDEYFKKSLLDKESYDMYYAVIQASLNDEPEVSIQCAPNCDAFSNVIHAVILDHPELISNRKVGVYHIVHDKNIQYRNDSNLNKIQTYFGTRRIAREMENIRKDTNGMSDKEKIIYVYNYVSKKDYDYYFTYNGSNQSAYSFFSKGSTVCAGFAKTSQIIFQNIGIKSYLVSNSDHMWNYVEYEGKYYVFDATVGACLLKDSPQYYDGLGQTTVGETKGNFEELYPEIEEETLRKIFDL